MADLEGPFLAQEPTGERTLPGIPAENYWFQRHVAAYEYAAKLVHSLEVLDAGCGEGYGSDILAASARDVVGVDLDEGVVAHAGRHYPRARFERADLLALPFPDASFDAVVSLQVIEHLSGPRDFVAECARVLRPGGRLIMSTPNRLTFSRDGIRNPFHTYEFAPEDFRSLLASVFAIEELAGTFHTGRLRVIERMSRRPFTERLLEQPAPEWPAWLRRAVRNTKPGDFAIQARDVEHSLDLVAVARR
ncbi:MAG: class I SAM-dependent methyltransferase [Actinomycetota bacterium]|nr:class I SAM-dependent methyltransferase [Actinomycetota bacterium]